MTVATSPRQAVVTDGLRAPVTIHRSGSAVPSVEAASLADAMCGLGYAIGRDRLFQLDLLRRRAAGRCAEILGPDALEEDVRQRALGLLAVADAAPVDDLAVAYAAGITRAIADQDCPVEYQLLGQSGVEPWTPRDCLLVALLMTHMLGGDGQERRMRDVMQRCLPDEVVTFLTSGDPYAVTATGHPVAMPAAVPAAAIRRLLAQGSMPPSRPVVAASAAAWGSNAMVAGPGVTRDGRAWLACDMHLPITAPALCYRASLSWPGHRAAGFFIPGIPVLITGATDELAWGVTRLAADGVDLVEIEPDPDDPGSYRGPAGWTPFTRRRERIEVRGQAPYEFTVLETEFGPVAGSLPGGGLLASHWIARDPGSVDLGLAGLLTAADVAEASAVAHAAGGAALNVMLADRAGHIGWTVSGRFPDRAQDAPAGVVRPARGERTWSRSLAAGQLPELLDPPQELLISANNGVAEHGTLAVNQFSARRAYRIAELLREQPVTEASLYAIQCDQDAGFFEFYRELVLSILPVTSPLGAAAAQWDGTARPESRGLVALVLLRELLRESWFGCLLAPCAEYDADFVYAWHSHEAPLRALLASQLAPAPYPDRATFLRTELMLCEQMMARLAPGTDPAQVPWGALNPSGACHPLSALAPGTGFDLDLPADPPGGCAESVCAARPGFGPAMRLVVSPGQLAAGLVNLPGGQSGDPRDPRYRDQFGAWLAQSPRPLTEPSAGPGLRLVPAKSGPGQISGPAQILDTGQVSDTGQGSGTERLSDTAKGSQDG